MRVNLSLSKDFLLEQYVEQKKSLESISRETKKSTHCIKSNLRAYDIKIRKFDGSNLTKEILFNEYVINKKSAYQISLEFGVSKTTILKRIKQYGIIVRTNSRLGRGNINSCRLKNNINSNDRFGKLVALKKIEGKIKEEWICVCDCGTERVVKTTNLTKGRTKSCGCLKTIKHDGYCDISGKMFCSYKRGALERNLEFNITPKDMWDLFIKQDMKCALSGVTLTINLQDRTLTTASLDRIDSEKGYTVDNIQWVHKTINTMKWNLSCDKFIEWCKIIAKNNEDNI